VVIAGITRVPAGGFSGFRGVCVGETQEIPATFTTETGWPGEDNCALVTSITLQKEWPLTFRRFPDMRRGVSTVSVGEGWARFMSDQALGLGALLTFKVVDERRLVVGIHRRSALTEQQQFQQYADTSLYADDSRVQPGFTNSAPDLPPRLGLQQVRGDARPSFQKKLRKTHTKKCASSRIVSRISHCFFISADVAWCMVYSCTWNSMPDRRLLRIWN
jgi:hypothetical protein